MKTYPETLKHTLLSQILSMACHREDFCRNPSCDFTRNRKLPFEKVLSILVGMGGHSMRDEMMEYFGYSPNIASVPAFVQQRNKILPKALEFLFQEFTQACIKPKLYKGYRLLAVDGSDLQFAADPKDKGSYFPGVNGRMHYSFLHLNALFDLISGIYLDAVVQKRRSANENEALRRMADRSPLQDPCILIADRGYESYCNLAHIQHRGWKYLIRLRENAGICSGFVLPDMDEFDFSINLVLVGRQTNAIKLLMKENPGLYRFLPAKHGHPFLSKGAPFYPLAFRIVRFKIGTDSYETVITNLDATLFPPNVLKELYHLRWGIETSFRQLKYTVGLRLFQSKKVEHVSQEIFARLLMYNFTELITSHAVIQNKAKKYTYQVNFSAAVHICRQFLRGIVPPPFVEALITRHLVPIRPGRSMPRRMNHPKFTGFFYRIA